MIDDLQYEEVAGEIKRNATPAIQVLQDFGIMKLDDILHVDGHGARHGSGFVEGPGNFAGRVEADSRQGGADVSMPAGGAEQRHVAGGAGRPAGSGHGG